MSKRDYVIRLGLFAGLMFAFVQLSILVVDPYGISPLRIDLVDVNHDKPRRLDIDRQLKPYEVWLREPKTVFLGTSRIHKSLKPNTLENSSFAPAYNAAVPAGSLAENLALLSQFIATNDSLETVFLVMFLYNFTRPQQVVDLENLGARKIVEGIFPFHFSLGAFLDSMYTLRFNVRGKMVDTHIHQDGYGVRDSAYPLASDFDQTMYTDSILSSHQNIPDMVLQPTAVDTMRKISEICRENQIRLVLLVVPSHPWNDYRLYSLGYWPLVEEWYREIAKYPDVFDFSKYNEYATKEASSDMVYWYDPLHASKNMGDLMLRALIEGSHGVGDESFYSQLTVDTVDSVLEMHLSSLKIWASENPDFVSKFNGEKLRAGNDYESRMQRMTN
jgi:hypothetical protein